MTVWNSTIDRRKPLKRGTKPIASKSKTNSKPRRYAALMRSKEWRGKVGQRERVLIRDFFECRLCGNQATEVHHREYNEQIADTPDSELFSLCGPCHKELPRK